MPRPEDDDVAPRRPGAGRGDGGVDLLEPVAAGDELGELQPAGSPVPDQPGDVARQHGPAHPRADDRSGSSRRARWGRSRRRCPRAASRPPPPRRRPPAAGGARRSPPASPPRRRRSRRRARRSARGSPRRRSGPAGTRRSRRSRAPPRACPRLTSTATIRAGAGDAPRPGWRSARRRRRRPPPPRPRAAPGRR